MFQRKNSLKLFDRTNLPFQHSLAKRVLVFFYAEIDENYLFDTLINDFKDNFVIKQDQSKDTSFNLHCGY